MDYRPYYWIPFDVLIPISLVLYFRLLYVVGRTKNKYNSFFFKVTLSQGVIDIIWIVWYFGGILLMIDQVFGDQILLSLNGPIFPRLLYYHTHYFLHAHVFGILSLSVNRYFVICRAGSPTTELLDEIPQWLVFILHLGVPAVVMGRMLLQDDSFSFRQDDGFVSLYTDLDDVKSNSMQQMIISTGTSVICSACYIAVIRTLLKLTAEDKSPNSSRWRLLKKKREVVLTGVCFALFVVLMVVAAYYAALHSIAAHGNMDAVWYLRNNFYPYCCLLISLVNPWMLFLTNKSIRDRVTFRKNTVSMHHGSTLGERTSTT